MNQAGAGTRLAHTVTLAKPGLAETPRGPLHAVLTVIRGVGPDLGRTVLVSGPVVVGRDPDCELPLQDRGVSRRHARVVPEGAHAYVLEDLGSTNGTRLDGQPLAGPHRLTAGEKFFLGQTVVRFALADAIELEFQLEVAQLVATDPLTGLGSKRSFDEALDSALECSQQLGEPLALLMLDLDGIKPINDRHGHLFGAHCIREAGKIIGQVVGEAGQACRFGGDEFSVFLPGQDRAAARATAEQIRTAVAGAALEKDGIRLFPTVSIGIAVCPPDASGALELTAAADGALYRAKHAGKNCVSV